MIEKHKMERVKQPFGLDDKLFEFTQNSEFERAHRNLMSYLTARPELQKETPEELYKQQLSIKNNQQTGASQPDENASGGKKKVGISSKEY